MYHTGDHAGNGDSGGMEFWIGDAVKGGRGDITFSVGDGTDDGGNIALPAGMGARYGGNDSRIQCVGGTWGRN